jgi:predicted dehydrogenase
MTIAVHRRQFLKAGGSWLGLASCSMSVGRRRGPRAGRSLEKLRTAHIGVGGMGASDLNSVASHPAVEVAALCDVDDNHLQAAAAGHPGARTFRDFREMFSRLGDRIDAVVISTPDHTHASATMTAMLAGKPVYCQKPLTHEVFESRQLREVAAEKDLVTQMGTQIHSRAVYKRAVRMIQDGVIGKVSAIHAWSAKNWGYDGPLPDVQAAIPDFLAWDLWLGPAPQRPFAPAIYHPANWRKFLDFGTGTLGDMGVHIFDTPFTALQLTAPDRVVTTCRPPTGVGHPENNIVEYEFPGTEFTTETLQWKWYDGKDAPPPAADTGLPPGTSLPGQGSLFIGEGGQMLLPHVGEAVLFPEAKFRDYRRPEVADENHYHQWVDACRGEGQCSMSFELAGPLTEALLLGVVANRFPGQSLQWNASGLVIGNHDAANELLWRPYREGFEVERLEGLAQESR